MKKILSQESGKLNKIAGGLVFCRNDFFGNAIVQWLLIGAFFLNIAVFAALFFFVRPDEADSDLPIIIHYNVYFGMDMMGDWWQAFILPATAAFFAWCNIFLAYFLYDRCERIASYILLITALLIQAGVAIAAFSIIAINN